MNATHLLNDRGLIFSGSDMTLRVNDFSNRYGDVYSLGGLDIARDDASGRSSLVENVSGSLESAGDMRLLTDALSNRRDQFSTEKKLVSGNINIYSNDGCKGKGCELYFTSVEKYEDVITGSSASAFITAGGELTVGSRTVDNLYSSMSAAKNILINTDVLTNRGAAGGEERHLNSGLYTRDRGIYSTFMNRQSQFNTVNNPNSGAYRPGEINMAQVMAGVGNFYETSTYVVPTTGSVIAQAVIQAAGQVTVNATTKIDNSVIRPNATDINTPAQNRNTNSDVFASTVKPAITTQLPPDLAQRQVNPVTLPGFTLPVGQNGLFRLSGQQGKAGVAGNGVTGNAGLSIDGRQITSRDREQALDYSAVQERGFSVDGQPLAGSVNGQGPSALDTRGVSIPRVRGLPEIAAVDNQHKYMIETNPALTDLKQFMSSDYLLDKLGVTPDQSNRRLGDGLYEQRLIREAVVARTGQRYIDGITSDDALYRYLMDNAIAYKDSLNLQLGVSLTAEQVAALTHDIVWMEEAEVNGQKVLTPVLYLANANNRLAPNGALIQGQDVNLISGGDLHNSGTLRATNNLSLTANNIDNSGLIQAGNRLEMLATDSIRNTRGGIVTGRDINATALTGDIINERTVTTFKREGDGYQLRDDVVSEGSRFEATDTLTLSAMRDVQNIGSTLKAGGNASIAAGRDVVIASQVEQDDYAYQRRRVSGTEQTIVQHASAVESGADLTIDARRDVSVVASRVSAAKDLSVEAGESLTVAAAANEEHEYSKGKKGKTKTTTQSDEVTQQGAELSAGGDLIAVAGTDVTLIASKISAGNDAYINAGNALNVLAAQNSSYSLYDMSKKGGWGSSKTQRDEVTDVTHVGTEIKAGANLTLESGGDQRYQAAKLESGQDLAIISDGAVTFEAVKDLHQESHQKSKDSMAWTSMSGKGKTDETLRQTQMKAQGELVIKAVDGLKIDIKHVDQQTVHQVINSMVAADPQLAWLAEAEKRGDVDWRRVEEIHTSFKYSHSGLGPAAQVVLAIALAVVTGGAGLGAGMVGAGAGTFAGGFADAVLAAVMNNAANSVISNKGNLGATFKDITSKDAMKGYVVSGMMGGIGGAMGYDPTTLGFDWNSVGQVVLKTGAETIVQTAFNGGSLGDNFANNLLGSVINIAGAVAANQIGNTTLVDGSPTKIAAHALLGGLKSMAMGGDFQTGALAGGANEALVQYLAELVLPDNYDPNRPGNQQAQVNLMAMSQLMGVLAAVVTGGDPEIAANIAANATQYNYLSHSDLERASKELLGCGNDTTCAEDGYAKYHNLSMEQTARALIECGNDPKTCANVSMLVAKAEADTARFKSMADSASPAVAKVLNLLIAENYGFQNDLAGVTAGHSAEAVADVLVQKFGITPERAAAFVAGVVLTVAAINAAKGGGGPKAPAQIDSPPVKNGWKVGDDVYNQTAKGNDPSWSAVRARFWKNEASAPDAASTYGSENLDRMSKGLAPQRYNADKGGVESMELSHEPIPARDGGKDFVPRWPQDHAAVDPYRKPGY
ncbi:DUF637 domain-containing protein [Pseudomonas poae]|nr:DUF637 domain-containing protein [Pseudomonas poae]